MTFKIIFFQWNFKALYLNKVKKIFLTVLCIIILYLTALYTAVDKNNIDIVRLLLNNNKINACIPVVLNRFLFNNIQISNISI